MPISLAHRFIPFALAAAAALLFAWTAPTAAAEKIKIEYWTWDPTIQEITMVPKGPERRVIYGGPDSVAISKYTKHPEAAWEFVKFLIGPNRPVGSDVRGRVPINRKLALDPAWIEWSGGLERGVVTLYESAPWVRGADFGTTKWMEWRVSAMNQALAPAFAAQSSVEEAARKASEAIDVILNTTVCRACP